MVIEIRNANFLPRVVGCGPSVLVCFASETRSRINVLIINGINDASLH